nr:reductase [Pseudomonadota bacterium]
RPLRQVLSEDLDITKPSDEAIEYLAGCAGDPDQAAALRALAAAGADEGQDLLELLETYPSVRPEPASLAAVLGRLQPRLYSIASSPRAHRDEVHLTVGVVRYSRNDRPRQGVASAFFADRLAAGEGVKVYIQPAHDFRLPDDGGASVIMVGPGTGIAPFRAFLQERQLRGDRGRNWLLFGNPNRASDFLYEEELAAFAASGLLTRLDTAFSRDQAEKVYVQQRMVEQGAELWAWLQAGAYFYVCGDAKRMARDVDAALHRIARTHGGLSAAQAQRFIGQLAKDRRYLRDVY